MAENAPPAKTSDHPPSTGEGTCLYQDGPGPRLAYARCAPIALPTRGGNAPAGHGTAGARNARFWRSLAGWGQMDLYLLVSEQLHASPAMGPPAPISPEQGVSLNRERMQQHTHPTWDLAYSRRATGTARTMNSLDTGGCGQHTRAAGCHQPHGVVPSRRALPSGAAQCAIRLQHKVSPGEVVLFEGQGYLGACIA